MENCIFCKIVNGEIPCNKVYEDNYTLAFIDIDPIQPGQILVISKKHVETFEQLEKEDYHALMDTVKKAALKIKSEFKPLRVGVIIEGFEVDHAHVKVFPINSGDELRNLPSNPEIDHNALQQMAERLKI
tara:strand:+ start:1482 stop:1871 length:390 start_codon:yes stop_codon:yes gene_type:complete